MDGERLYIERVLRHVSQRELARRLGVTHTSVGRWERGVKPVPRARIAQIISALDGRTGEKSGA